MHPVLSQPGAGAPTAGFVIGEAVALDLRTAALPSRAIARLADLAAQGTLLIVLSLLTALVSLSGVSDAVGATLGVLILVVVVVGYPVALETLLHGRTPGKVMMGLRVVRDDGGPIGFRQALVRGLFVLVDLVTLFSVSVVVMLLNDRNKRLGDLFAGTVVLQERVAVPAAPTPMMPSPLVGWAQQLDLGGLGEDLAGRSRQFLGRSQDLTEPAREQLGRDLVGEVVRAVAATPPPGTPGWAVLSAVLAERRRRQESAAPAGGDPATAAPAGDRPAPAGDESGLAAPAPAESGAPWVLRSGPQGVPFGEPRPRPPTTAEDPGGFALPS